MSIEMNMEIMPSKLKLSKPQTSKLFLIQDIGHYRELLADRMEYITNEEEYFGRHWSIVIRKADNSKKPALQIYLRCRSISGAEPQSMDVSLNFMFFGYTFLRKIVDLDAQFTGKEEVELCGGELLSWNDLKITREEFEATQVFPTIPDEELRRQKHWGAIGKRQNRNPLPHAIRITVGFKETQLNNDDFLRAADPKKEHRLEVGSRTFFVPNELLKELKLRQYEKRLKERVDPIDFQHLLSVSSKLAEINDWNIEGLLLVSSMLNAHALHKKCRNFITNKSSKPLEKKFQLALQYGWDSFKNQCIIRFENAKHLYNSIPSYLQTLQPSDAQEEWEEKLKKYQRDMVKQEIQEGEQDAVHVKEDVDVDEDEPMPKKQRINGESKLISKAPNGSKKATMAPKKTKHSAPSVSRPPTKSLAVPKLEVDDDYEDVKPSPLITPPTSVVPLSRSGGRVGTERNSRGSRRMAARNLVQDYLPQMIVSTLDCLNMTPEQIEGLAKSSETAEALIACLDDTSMESLEDETGKLSNEVLFKILFIIVQSFNSHHPENKVGLFDFKMAKSERADIENEMLFNEDGLCQRFILPVHTVKREGGSEHKEEHFAVVYMDKEAGHILYADSAQLFHLEDSKIKNIATKLGMRRVRVEKLGTNLVPFQKLGNSCGVHVAANIHAFLELGLYIPEVQVDAELLRAQMVTFIKKAHSVKMDYGMEVGVPTNWSRNRINVPGGEAKDARDSE